MTTRLDVIEARAAAATEGPWLAGRPTAYPLDDATVYFDPVWDVWVWEDGEWEFYLASTAGMIYDEGGHTVDDARFIAASRTDVPLLLAAARAARNVLALFVEQSSPTGYECRDCGADVTHGPAFMKPETHDADCEVRPLLVALAPLLEPEP